MKNIFNYNRFVFIIKRIKSNSTIIRTHESLKLYDNFKDGFLVIEGFGNLSESEYDKIESDVNDMFIDLKDSGAIMDINFYHKGVGYGVGPEDYMIKVRIYSERKFSMVDIEESTRMMVDYFKDLTDNWVDMEYDMASDYTNTRQSKFNPYSFDKEVTIYLIERGNKY